MTPEQLIEAHRGLWRQAFGPRSVAQRLERGRRQLSTGGMWLSLAMNGFYGLKRLTGSLPATVPPTRAGLIDHPITHAEHEESGPDASTLPAATCDIMRQ